MLSSLFFLKILWIKATICFTFSYLIGFISIKKYIQFIHNKKLFQPIRAEGPETHLKAKKNTPTMGGIFIILSTLITTFLFIDITNRYILVVCCIMLTFASIGLVDDILKVVYKNPKGFRGSYKILIQFLVIGMAFLWLNLIDSTHGSTYVFLPFFESVKFFYLPLPFYIIFVTMLIVGTSNAVNLTDGLDGLVSVPVIINLLCLILLIHASSSPELALKFSVPPIMFSGELIFFCISLIGAILAFLTFNLKPAKIFMGDVGSLGIGSTLGIIAIIVKQELVFFIISLLFVIEASSVIIQVFSFKIFKKRVFKMAPIHHHFEKIGWSEKKVVYNFWLASLIFASIGVLIFLF
jgi:phospho-N-acetylmuramoyl-pentapeptide-transferase